MHNSKHDYHMHIVDCLLYERHFQAERWYWDTFTDDEDPASRGIYGMQVSIVRFGLYHNLKN